jgi:hypothetical protein
VDQVEVEPIPVRWTGDWVPVARVLGAIAAVGAGVGESFESVDGFPPATTVDLLLWAASIVVLVRGPAPRRCTRWAWFWIITLLPTIGALLWFGLEVPWSRRAAAWTGSRQRLTGGPAFWAALGAGVVLATALTVLEWLT